jgi:TonB family protein
MELIEGRSLQAHVGDPETPIGLKLAWLIEIAQALGAAHQAGLVHRDVKPDNVMIRHDGTVKVLDFGIARSAVGPLDTAAPTEAQLDTLTREGAVIGTPRYMAPEQIRRLPLDGRCDQFAWGIMAFELLSGQLPFRGDDALSLLASVLTDEPAPLGPLVPDLSPAVAAVVARTLHKNPDQRFSSMEDLVEAARNSHAPSPTAATPGLPPPAAPGLDSPAMSVGFAPTERLTSDAVTALNDTGESASSRRIPWAALAMAGVGAGAAALANRPRKSPRKKRWGLALGLVGAAGALLAARHARSPLHAGSATASSSQAAGAFASRPVIPCELAGAPMPSACASAVEPWCGTDHKLVACCSKGMVPTDEDGICGCPPGGSKEDGASKCPRASGDYTEQIRTIVRSRFPEIRTCYELGLAEKGEHSGRVAVYFLIDPRGQVFDARLKESGLPSAEAQRCTLKVFRALQFPPPPNGITTVEYPISFAPGN